jgi:hypothetical protein
MLTKNNGLRTMDGLTLLALAVFRPYLKKEIDAELDRRASTRQTPIAAKATAA